MKTIDTVEGNKLIAEFMGGKDVMGNGGVRKILFELGKSPIHNKLFYIISEDLQYHTSWDWLMPVVEKIESLGQKCEIGISSCTFYSAKYNVERTYADTKIRATWLAVVEFIKWYNENKK